MAALAALMALATLAGCAGPGPTPQQAAALAALPYPADAQRGPDLDILAVREGDALRLVNRTPQAYAGMQLWLNRQYVLPVERIDIGTGNVLTLTHFVNRYGESFPVGGLLTPDKDRPLLLAELYDPAAGVKYPLVVSPGG